MLAGTDNARFALHWEMASADRFAPAPVHVLEVMEEAPTSEYDEAGLRTLENG